MPLNFGSNLNMFEIYANENTIGKYVIRDSTYCTMLRIIYYNDSYVVKWREMPHPQLVLEETEV